MLPQLIGQATLAAIATGGLTAGVGYSQLAAGPSGQTSSLVAALAVAAVTGFFSLCAVLVAVLVPYYLRKHDKADDHDALMDRLAARDAEVAQLIAKVGIDPGQASADG